MAKRKRHSQQLSLFDETTLRSLERSKPVVKKVAEPAEPVRPHVVDVVHTVWGRVEVTEEMDSIINDMGFSSYEAMLMGEEPKPPRPPTKTKQSAYASKRVKGRPEI